MLDKEQLDMASLPITTYVCSICNRDGFTIYLHKIGKYLICPICGSSMINNLEDSKDSFMEEIKQTYDLNSDELLDWKYYPPHPFNRYLRFLLDLAHNCILSGQYLPSILTMNYYIEALVKEVIFINEGSFFKGELGPALKYARDKRYISERHRKLLDSARVKIRNPFTHVNTGEILGNYYIPIHYGQFSDDPVKTMEKMIGTEDNQTRFVGLSEAPNLMFEVAHNSLIRSIAINCYNACYDLAKEFDSCYLSKLGIIDHLALLKEKSISYEELKEKNAILVNESLPGWKPGRFLIVRNGSINTKHEK